MTVESDIPTGERYHHYQLKNNIMAKLKKGKKIPKSVKKNSKKVKLIQPSSWDLDYNPYEPRFF